ncbi:hypothetical protein BGX34_006174 [Mortierella sp. NVP85]|nr:hypothetical protein BGX34_006174 [Mortierella sp. NVP85]
MSLRHPFTTKSYLVVGCLLAWLTCALADIQCASPMSGTFKEGDPMTLSWTSSGSPRLSDVTAMNGELYCDSGVKIADIPNIDWRQSMVWTVPSVGNATVPGGTTGTCPGNKFHVQYSGKYKGLFEIPVSYGPVKCDSITIMPNPGIVPTTTTSVARTTSTKTATSSAASPTNSDEAQSGDGSQKTFIIIIVCVVAALIFFLVIFATWWRLRKKRIERMENAVMPWSQPSNPFSKVPSMDGGDRREGSNKPQPATPSAAYHQDEYGRHGAGGYGGNQHGYDGYNANGQGQDEYYNPYYAQNMHGAGQGYGGGHAGMMDPSYGSSSPYQNHHDPYQQHAKQGFYPPPPVSSASHAPMAKSPSNMSLGSATLSSTNLTLSSSVRRGPQVILPEKGSPYDDEGSQQIPMKDLTPKA